MRKTFLLLLCLVLLLPLVYFQMFPGRVERISNQVLTQEEQKGYWFILHRKSNQELLYFGEPGNSEKSNLVKTFKVKTGIPGERPTPLPGLLGKEYWLITGKYETFDSPETAPYFLTLDIPVSEESPFGPEPYLECDGQCNWELPGAFGLHGIGGDLEKIGELDPGSSGCVRHTNEDITYLYQLLDPEKREVRYYVEDV